MLNMFVLYKVSFGWFGMLAKLLWLWWAFLEFACFGFVFVSCLFGLGIWYFGLFGLVILGLIGFGGLGLECGGWVVVRQFRDFGNLVIFWSEMSLLVLGSLGILIVISACRVVNFGILSNFGFEC